MRVASCCSSKTKDEEEDNVRDPNTGGWTMTLTSFRKVAQLEQKLDGLVQLLTAKDHEQSYPSPESIAGRGTAQSPQAGVHSRMVDDGVSGRRNRSSFLTVSEEYAQECLDIFKQKLMINFPFVVVPPDRKAEELRSKRPALFGAIVVAASFRNIKTQIVYGEDLLRYFTEAVLMRGEKSLELLQALLVYTAWYVQVTTCFRTVRLRLHVGITMYSTSRDESLI